MSWDVFIQDLPAEARTVSEIPDDFRPAPIGRRADLVAAIKAGCPEAAFRHPSEGRVRGDGFSIEIAIGDDDPVRCISLHVRGNEDAAAVVARIVQSVGLRALDTGTGEFFDLDDPAAGLLGWSGYRRTVVGD